MSESHTADLQTRYRYREEGRLNEIERREAWLNRVRTWYPEKADIWMEGYETAETRNLKILEQMFDAAENAETRRLITTAIHLIKEGNKWD